MLQCQKIFGVRGDDVRASVRSGGDDVRNEGAARAAVGVVQYDSVHVAHRDDGSIAVRCADVGVAAVAGDFGCDVYIYGVGCGENLPYRNLYARTQTVV